MRKRPSCSAYDNVFHDLRPYKTVHSSFWANNGVGEVNRKSRHPLAICSHYELTIALKNLRRSRFSSTEFV